MIDLNTVNEIYLYAGTTDFRFGIYGLSKIVLSQFNKDYCRLSTIIKIADAYGIDAKDLLFEDLEVKFKDKKLVYKISIN